MSKRQWCHGAVVETPILKKTFFLEPSIHISLVGTFDFPLLIYFTYLAFKVEGDGHLNPFSPKSDQNQVSPNNINTSSREKVGRIKKMMNKGEML